MTKTKVIGRKKEIKSNPKWENKIITILEKYKRRNSG